MFVAAFMSLAIFLFSLTSLPSTVLNACYVGWALSVAVT